IEAWTHHLTELLIEDLQRRGYRILSNRDPRRRSAIVTFAPAGDPKAAWERLRAAGVVLSLREGYLRVSPHGYNTEDEVLQVGAVLGNA
ncbi:MAG: aminotransferase class V-fold PLP-dependent enzyme, partial [Chloroflexi bacterium]